MNKQDQLDEFIFLCAKAGLAANDAWRFKNFRFFKKEKVIIAIKKCKLDILNDSPELALLIDVDTLHSDEFIFQQLGFSAYMLKLLKFVLYK